MNREEFNEIKSIVDRAKKNLEEIRKARVEYQNALRQLDLNEAGWTGALEAVSPLYEKNVSEFESEENTENSLV